MATTTNYGFTKPTVGADTDVWGGYVNTDLDSIDAQLFLSAPKASPVLTGVATIPAIKPGADGTNAISIQTTGAVSMARIDTTNKRVSLGSSVAAAPGATLVVSDNATNPAPVVSAGIHVVGADAANPRIEIDAFGASVGAGVICRVASNTAASPSAVTSGISIGQYGGRGYLATGWSPNLGSMEISAEEPFTDSTAKTGLKFTVTPSGSVTAAEKMRLNGAGQLIVGASTPTNASCGIELSSTTMAIMAPRMTTTQRDALTAAAGMVIYNTTTGKLNVRGASAWEAITSV